MFAPLYPKKLGNGRTSRAKLQQKWKFFWALRWNSQWVRNLYEVCFENLKNKHDFFHFLKVLPSFFFQIIEEYTLHFKPIVFCIKMSQWQFSAYQSCTKQEWKCSENWLIYRALQLCPQNQGHRKVWKSGEGTSYNLVSKTLFVFRALK